MTTTDPGSGTVSRSARAISLSTFRRPFDRSYRLLRSGLTWPAEPPQPSPIIYSYCINCTPILVACQPRRSEIMFSVSFAVPVRRSPILKIRCPVQVFLSIQWSPDVTPDRSANINSLLRNGGPTQRHFSTISLLGSSAVTMPSHSQVEGDRSRVYRSSTTTVSESE